MPRHITAAVYSEHYNEFFLYPTLYGAFVVAKLCSHLFQGEQVFIGQVRKRIFNIPGAGRVGHGVITHMAGFGLTKKFINLRTEINKTAVATAAAALIGT